MDSPIVMDAVKKGIVKNMEPSRLYDAVNVILTLQNEDGGECHVVRMQYIAQLYLLLTNSFECFAID